MLIGKPDTDEKGGKIEVLLEQLRQRQLSIEQMETYERQREASEKRRVLAEAQAQADMQTSLTNARVKAQIAESEGEAELQRARKQAEKQVVMADAQLAQSRRQAEQTLVLAEADSQQAVLAGRGEAQRVMQVGISEAAVLMQKVNSYGDPRLFALTHVGNALSKSTQPLVPERLFVSGGDLNSALPVGAASSNGHDSPSRGANPTTGVVGLLLQALLAERTSFADNNCPELAALREATSRAVREALVNLPAPSPVKLDAGATKEVMTAS